MRNSRCSRSASGSLCPSLSIAPRTVSRRTLNSSVHTIAQLAFCKLELAIGVWRTYMRARTQAYRCGKLGIDRRGSRRKRLSLK